MGGIGGTVTGFQTLFKDTWLPMPLVTLHAWLVPWIELLLPIWLIVGYRLRYAWGFAGLFLTTLGFGMIVAGKGDVAADNFRYVLIACVGLYFSRHDGLSIDALGRKKEACCSK